MHWAERVIRMGVECCKGLKQPMDGTKTLSKRRPLSEITWTVGRMILALFALRLLVGHFLPDPLLSFGGNPLRLITVMLDALLVLATCMFFFVANDEAESNRAVRQANADERAMRRIEERIKTFLQTELRRATGDPTRSAREEMARAAGDIQRALTESQPNL